MKSYTAAAALLASPIAFAHPACAAPAKFGEPVVVGDGLTLDPMLDAWLRWENVDTPAKSANAITLRVRSGIEIKHAPSHLSFLAEVEATGSLVNNYNALPFIPARARPAYANVADPQNIELNRLQIQYRTKTLGLTIGWQRINLDDQR